MARADQVAEASAKHWTEYEYILIKSGLIDTPTREGEPSEVYLGYSVRGVRVHRLYLENGTTLSPEKQKQVDNDVARVLKKGPRLPKDKGKSTADSFTPLLAVGTFNSPRCRLVNGRASYVLEYTGNPKAKTSGMEAKALSHLHGTFVFDTEDGEWASTNMTLGSDVRLALIFKLKQGLALNTSNTRVAPGVWLTSSEKFSGKVRMYFNGLSTTMEEHYIHYRPIAMRDQDAYRGVAYGQLPPEIRSAMTGGLAAAAREPLADEAE